jgi:hypothetical protein
VGLLGRLAATGLFLQVDAGLLGALFIVAPVFKFFEAFLVPSVLLLNQFLQTLLGMQLVFVFFIVIRRADLVLVIFK